MNTSTCQGRPPRDTQDSTIAVAHAQSPADGTLPKYRDLSPKINPDRTIQGSRHDPTQGPQHVAREPDVGDGGQHEAATGPAEAYIFREEFHEHQERVEGEPLVPATHHETAMPPRK